MATEQNIYDLSLQAAADYCTTSKQFYIMKIDANGHACLAGAAHGDSIGVLQNKPKQYEAAEIRKVGISKVVCGGSVAIGAEVIGDSDSKAVTATANQRYVGVALETGAAGRVISILTDSGYMPAS